MSKRRWILAVAIASALLPGCGVALIGVGGAAAYTAIEDRRTAGTQIEDEGIELRAGNRIGERFGDKAHVNVNSYNRWLLLTGEVQDEATRAEIEKIALAVPAVRGVTNELQIAGISSLASRANDSYLSTKVKARFVDARRLNPVHVKVTTEAGVVYLMGVVTERESNDAVDVARTTGGVRKVVKVFEYCSPSDELCRPRPRAPEQAPKAKPAP